MKDDEKISRELKNLANHISKEIHDITGSDIHRFSLVIFNPIENERLNYISNYDRNQVINVWKTLIIAWENAMPDIPTHKLQ